MGGDEHLFEDDVKINKYKLEDECERHPGMYHYWINCLAEAKTALDKAEDKEKLILAKRQLFIRSHWSDSDGKLTESSVFAVLEQDDDVQEAKAARRKAQASVNTLNAAVTSLDHRKSMLDNLVYMLSRGFYAAPNGGHREGPSEQAERDIRGHMNQKGDGV